MWKQQATKMSSDLLFSKTCWQNTANISFMYQQQTATVHIFLEVLTADYLVFFSNHISWSAVLTQVSIITCKQNFKSFSCIGFNF